MAKTANRIPLSGEGEYVQKIAAGTISPGHLMELDSAGKYKAHATVANDAMKVFALEDALQGKTVDDDYAAAEQVFGFIAYPGSKVQCIIKTGDTVALGSPLYSAGDGTLTVTKGSATNVVAYSEEAITTAAAGEFCQARVI